MSLKARVVVVSFRFCCGAGGFSAWRHAMHIKRVFWMAHSQVVVAPPVRHVTLIIICSNDRKYHDEWLTEKVPCCPPEMTFES
jgi:hypothetical protein